MLDAFGPIGGFNFLWAWATGRAAGVGAAQRLTTCGAERECMLPELDERRVVLERTRESFLDTVRSGSESQRRFRPRGGVWSMLDVTEHLVLAEEKSLLGILKGPRPGTR